MKRLLSAAIRTTCQARAPRRTVAAVAAAVATALLQHETVPASAVTVPKASPDTHGAQRSLEEAEAQIKLARAAKRRLKRHRRRERAKAAAGNDASMTRVVVPQTNAARETVLSADDPAGDGHSTASAQIRSPEQKRSRTDGGAAPPPSSSMTNIPGWFYVGDTYQGTTVDPRFANWLYPDHVRFSNGTPVSLQHFVPPPPDRAVRRQ